MPSLAIGLYLRRSACVLVGLVACRSQSEPEPEPVLAVASGALVGCIDRTSDRVCVFEPGRPLTIWLETGAPGARLSANGMRLDAEGTATGDGMRWRVEPKESWRSLKVQGDSAQVEFALVQRRPPAPELEGVRALRDAGQLEEAQAQLAKRLPTLSKQLQVEAHELDGDLAFLRGDVKTAIAAYGSGARQAAAQSRNHKASSMAQRIAYACTALEPNEACARTWLDRDSTWSDGNPEQNLLHDYYRALFDARVGDRRAAQRGFGSVIERADAMGLQSVQVGALLEAMLLVAAVGNWSVAKRHQARAEALGATLPPEMQAQLQNAIGWMLLLARARGRTDLSSPTPAFERALHLTSRGDALSRRLRATLRLNLAYDALLNDDLDGVRRWLATVDRTALLHEDERMWAALLRARVEARLDHLDAARKAFATLATKATATHESEIAWHAHVGIAEVLARQGRTAEAIESHEQAASILRRQLPRIALGAGRSHYLAERSRGTQQHIELLLDSGRTEDALCVTRRARTRNLRVLAQNIKAGEAATEALRSYREGRTRLERDLEAAWMLPADQAKTRFAQLRADRLELYRTLDRDVFAGTPGSVRSCTDFPRPQHDEVSLHYVELEEEWVGFSVGETATSVRHLGPRPDSASPEALGQWLLSPFSDRLSEAQNLRVVASGPLHAVEFSQLRDPSFPDQKLGLRISVTYALDVPNPQRAPQTQGSRRMLVVAPPSNLVAAQAERAAVLAAAHDGGEKVQLLSGDEATGDAVRRALVNADLVHFIGHAASEDEGWTGRLQLARGDVLEVEDVLALEAVPHTLILAGCETGRVDSVALAGGMSLAHAFLLAGADTVVAADSQIPDRATSALARPFYAALRAKEPAAKALATAQAAVRAAGLTPPALRVWVR